MGLVHVTVRVLASRKSRRKYEGEFLVDTGSIDCMAPASDLRKAGIVPVGHDTYELADGSTAEYEFGLAAIEFLDTITAGRIIFGPERSEPILGVTALEAAGYVVDPKTQRLRKLPALPLK